MSNNHSSPTAIVPQSEAEALRVARSAIEWFGARGTNRQGEGVDSSVAGFRL